MEAPMSKLSANVCMYRLNELGDCFLLTFSDGDHRSDVLVDCGSFRNSGASKKRLQDIVDDIGQRLNGKSLDVVVGTHQHNDHLSGFVHCEDRLRTVGVDQVWLSWLDDPRSALARSIGEKHGNLRVALTKTARMVGNRGPQPIRRLHEVLGFYGAATGAAAAGGPPALPADAVKRMRKLGKHKPRYLKPGEVFDLPGMPTDTVRVYVLGPPKDTEDLYRKDPRTGESYDHALAVANAGAGRFLGAVAAQNDTPQGDEENYPFNERYKRRGVRERSDALKKLSAEYRSRVNNWRSVDDAWLDQAESLALFLDSWTNNSSLVLAIELVHSAKVLLFAADAQTGNWLSWPKVKWAQEGVDLDALLANTVLYKVGHHGSHNATLVDALEKMEHPDLVALIPVHKQDPNIKRKSGGWKMPAPRLFKRLREKTDGRVLQMDGKNPPSCNPRGAAAAAWRRSGAKLNETDLTIEVVIADR
jgi:glyoxylase-like metal-dependent hydrolase (beta-lactamase superfamily II)